MEQKEAKQLNTVEEIAKVEATAVANTATAASLKRKSIILVASILLLIAVLIAGSIAWYTKITGAHGMTLNAATAELRANFVDKHVVLDTNQFTNVNEDKCAPGTAGVLPIELQSTGETGLDYSIQLDFTTMAPEFKERVRYYYTNASGTDITINPEDSMETNGNKIQGKFSGQNATTMEFIKWEWVWTLESENFYSDGYWYEGDKTYDNFTIDDVPTTLTGKQYFDWLYPSADGFWYNNVHYSAGQKVPKEVVESKTGSPTNIDMTFDQLRKANAFNLSTDQQFLDEAREAWDAFDTEVGLGHFDRKYTSSETNVNYDVSGYIPDGSKDKMYAYQKAMEVKLVITGAQAMPEQGSSSYPTKTVGNITEIEEGYAGYVIMNGHKYWVQKENGTVLQKDLG